MKLKYKFGFQPVGDVIIGVTVGEDDKKFNGMLQLDDVSYDIVLCMTDDVSRDQLIDKMLDIYDADRDAIAESVDKVISYLRENQLIIDEN